MPPPDPFLTLENLYVKNINQTLFSNLNLQINEGEYWALIGDSKSGKNELVKTLAGKYLITGGEYVPHFYQKYLQQNPVKDPLFGFEKLISLVPQKHSFKNLSNTSDFYYQQRYNASDADDAPTVKDYLSNINPNLENNAFWNLDKVLNTLYLLELANKHLIKLSNGETRRLLIAGALIKNPSLLLLDHPFTGLDKDMRIELNVILKNIAATGITIVLTTSPTEIPSIITHIAILREKLIYKIISPKEFDPSQISLKEIPNINITELKKLIPETPAPQFETIVKMEKVTIKYGENTVLSNVDWEILPGDRWALSGPNGAGKTILLSLINGDNPQAYANKIFLFDRRRGSGESIWEIKKKIGFVSPEFYQYFPADFTCLQVVESGFYDSSGLYRKSNPENAAIALHWMNLFEIEQEAHQLLNNLSGSTQRLSILARALVKNPPLLILDEPTQGLDHYQQVYFKEIIENICQLSNTTLIYVTHYQEELPGCINNFLELDKGKIKNIKY
ncbi:ATP-binding cassette domain-containing protein [soil metagenome]